MEGLRNPFAVRNGIVILIEDLSVNERGLACQCQCPACNGEFVARMGDIKAHHFAHSKDACDEVLAYTSGLYKLIKQILDNNPFYVPALAVSYDFPRGCMLDESNIERYIKIVREGSNIKNKITISAGCFIIFENAELCYDSKKHIQALELTYKNMKIAIKVMPPDTACKTTIVSPHKEMTTLVLDFADDLDMIQSSNSSDFQEYVLSERLDKYWISNSKVRHVYPQIIELIKKANQEWIEIQRQLKEKRKLDEQRYREVRKFAVERQAVLQEEQERLYAERRLAELANNEEQAKIKAMGYEQVKNKFTQQEEQIRDGYNRRWVQCELCGEIKIESEFSSYGGVNHVNLGKCFVCTRKRERSE